MLVAHRASVNLFIRNLEYAISRRNGAAMWWESLANAPAVASVPL